MRIPFALLLLAACCAAVQITDPRFSFSSQGVETHLVIIQDNNRAANQGVDLTVSLNGTGAPSITPEEVLSIVGGSVEVTASDKVASVSSATPRHVISPFLLSALVGLIGMLAGIRFRYLGVVLVSLALLMGGSVALKQFDPSWKLTVTATIPPSMSLTSLNINILRGSVTMVGGSLAVSTDVVVDLCDDNGYVGDNFINIDAASFSLPGTSTFCATKKVILQNVVVPKGANLQASSLKESAYVFVKDSFAGVFDVSCKNGYAISTACNDKTMDQTETMAMRGSCGVQLVNGTASTAEAKVTVSAYYDAVFAVAEGITAIARSALRWSDPATWGGQIPQNGTDVVIGKNQVILLDTTTAWLRSLEIRGTLIADQNRDFLVTSDSIQVYGTLRVGSLYDPYTRKGVFTMTGAKGNYTSRAPLLAFSNSGYSRVLMAQPGANLQLYSALPRATYTRLNDHAAQNSTVLTVDSIDGWQVGDFIAISPTTFPSTSQTDRRQIVAINAQTKQVTIGQGLSYARWGKIQYMTDQGISLTQGVFEKTRAHPEVSDTIDERAVIVHLTRNIVINSPNDSDWQAGHGVHVMWMGQSTQVQLSGVEVHRAGQAGALGRYPLHAHMMSYNIENANSLTEPSDGVFIGDASGVFVRNCAVHNSVNRAYTIHGTCGARYENNVAYDILGHAFFFEDGSEIRNHFIGNVVLNVRRPDVKLRIQLTDERASGIWFSNGNNHFRNNIVGDIRNGVGIWNNFAQRPAPSYTVVSIPSTMTFQEFPNTFQMPLETWTMTNLNGTHWSATGSVSGLSNLTAASGSQYSNGFISIQLTGTAPVGSKIVIKIEGYVGGCFGQSRNVALFPGFTPPVDYSNNTAFSCASNAVMTDLMVNDELGNTGTGSFITTDDHLPNPDTHNGKNRVPTRFDRTRMWMNEVGYGNRVYNPLYTRWIVSDNQGTDLRGATQNGRLEYALFVGNSLNRLEPKLYQSPRHAFATYHFAMQLVNISFFHFPTVPKVTFTSYGLLDVNGVIESWDLYLSSLEAGPKNKLVGWKMFDVAPFERTPPPNLEQIYPNNTGGSDRGNRYWTLSGALWDYDGMLAGVPGQYLTFDHPFFTYNLGEYRQVIPGSRTLATSTTFYGLAPRAADPDHQRQDYAPITFERLNNQDLTVVANWTIQDGAKSSFFPNMRHASVVKNGIYRVYNHVDRRPNRQLYEIGIYSGQATTNATVIVALAWASDVPAKLYTCSYWNQRSVPGVASFAALRATPRSFYQEPNTNTVWYHHSEMIETECTVNIQPK